MLNKVYTATDIGLVRPVNEDNFAVYSPDVFVVADGMGGHAAGEIASKILVETVRDCLSQKSSIDEKGLHDSVLCAHKRVLKTVDENPSYSGMGTTATIAHIEEDCLYWAHVGDSRLYLFREGTLSQITHDHSYVESLVQRGEITPEEARVHPKKNIILRAVGMDGKLTIDTGKLPLHKNDKILLATDGLMNMVTDQEITKILSFSDGDLAKSLIHAALKAGAIDNVTAIVVVFKP